MRRFFGLVVLIAVCCWGFGQWQAYGDSRWTKIDDGLEMRTFTMPVGAARIPVYAYRASPNRCVLLQDDSLTAEKWLAKGKAKVVVNGGYFDKSGIPMGLRVGSGKRRYNLISANWGVFFIRNGKAYITHTRDYKPSKDTWQAVQCGPRLVVNGKTTDLKPQTGRRTGVGIDSQGKVVLAIADGPVTLDAWAEQWTPTGGLGCRNALNLDGGGSTQLAVKSKEKNLTVHGLWPVPDCLAFK